MYLNGLDVPFQEPFFSVKQLPEGYYDQFEKEARAIMPVREPEDRIKDFEAINLGFSEEQAVKEAQRCLDCGCHDYNDCKLIKCANLYELDPSKVNRLKGKLHPDYNKISESERLFYYIGSRIEKGKLYISLYDSKTISRKEQKENVLSSLSEYEDIIKIEWNLDRVALSILVSY